LWLESDLHFIEIASVKVHSCVAELKACAADKELHVNATFMFTNLSTYAGNKQVKCCLTGRHNGVFWHWDPVNGK
jgi:hypothetical protein